MLQNSKQPIIFDSSIKRNAMKDTTLPARELYEGYLIFQTDRDNNCASIQGKKWQDMAWKALDPNKSVRKEKDAVFYAPTIPLLKALIDANKS